MFDFLLLVLSFCFEFYCLTFLLLLFVFPFSLLLFLFTLLIILIVFLGPYTFSIGDTSSFGDYIRGGVATQVKMPKVIRFKPFEESLAKPEILTSDFIKEERKEQIHLGFLALDEFEKRFSRLPIQWSRNDGDQLVSIAQEINNNLKVVIEIDANLIHKLSFVSRGQLAPVNAVIGGIAAQELMKACSGL